MSVNYLGLANILVYPGTRPVILGSGEGIHLAGSSSANANIRAAYSGNFHCVFLDLNDQVTKSKLNIDK